MDDGRKGRGRHMLLHQGRQGQGRYGLAGPGRGGVCLGSRVCRALIFCAKGKKTLDILSAFLEMQQRGDVVYWLLN